MSETACVAHGWDGDPRTVGGGARQRGRLCVAAGVAVACLFVCLPTMARAAGVQIYYDTARSGTGQSEIWRMNLDGSGQQLFITGGSEPSWSADGTKMLYLATNIPHCLNNGGTGGGMFMVGADGQNPTSLGAGACGDARISPDGTQVAYESAPDVLSVLQVANPSSPTQIVPVPPGGPTIACETALGTNHETACSFATEPSWMGSSTVVYSDDTSEGGGLWSFSSSGVGTVPASIANNSMPNGLNYGISGESVDPGGTKVAVSTNLETNNPESIYVIPVGGSTGTEIAAAPAGHNYVYPQWSPDGSTIVFEDDGPGGTTIDSVSSGGGAIKQLTPNDMTARNPTFGPAASTGGISGTVTDDVGDIPLVEAGVVVQATGSNGRQTTATTGANGQYHLSLPPGAYTVAPEGHTFMPASRHVTLTGFTSNVDFDDEPAGVMTLGLEELSFGVATYSLGIPAGLHGSGTGPLLPGSTVTKPLDNTSPQIQRDTAAGKLFPIAFLDIYQPGTTLVAFSYRLTNARIEQFIDLGGQPLSESVTVSAESATRIMVPSCSGPIPGVVRVAHAAHASLCPLTEGQKDAALAAYQKYSDEAANLANSQHALGCLPHASRGVAQACAAIALLRAYAVAQTGQAKKILQDPPDRHFKTVAKPAPVHPEQINGRRFKAFNRLIGALAQIGSLESALVTSANRESGAHSAKSKSGVKRQRSAITKYAKRIIALTGKIGGLGKGARESLAGFRAKGHKQAVVVDFADLLTGDKDLARAMRPSAR